MPEILEVEYYRRLADGAVGRSIQSVAVPDPKCLRGSITVPALRRALIGSEIVAARRIGKLLLLDLSKPHPTTAPIRTPQPTRVSSAGPNAAGGSDPDAEHTLGVRFGMTGGLVLDDRMAIDRLLYSPGRFGEQWVRFRLGLTGGGELALHDPRRFGRVELDPDESVLGPDALSVTPAGLRRALAAPHSPGGGPPLKARLLDQAHLAGVGNLLADEMLWRANLAPGRPSASLTDAELKRLHRHLRSTLDQLLERGGSHTGDLMTERHAEGRCPRDGVVLRRESIGGRTTYWCPRHQL